MRIFKLTILIIILISCNVETKGQSSVNIRTEFSQIVDEIIRYKLNKASVVQIETMPVFKSVPIDTNSRGIPAPPPPDLIDYSKHFFNAMIEREILTTIDADYMYSSIDSSLIMKVDPKFISKSTLNKKTLDDLFKKDYDYAYEYLTDHFGTSCFIKVGTPIFNKAHTRLILAVDYYCGPLNGQGYIFILKKENAKWMIIEELGTWES